MLDRIDEYGILMNMTNMERIHDLYTQLVANNYQLDALIENILKLEKESDDIDKLEKLFENEFLLYMTNVGIHEDLMNALDEEEPTQETEFELARIRKATDKLLRAEVVEI